ncbi:hypothetical protein, partial [Sphingobium sp. Sx8-8]|uniref:hypothetical protein n=1 Tax=Sphingobium sp. Sx8-8 TaxID=2933617 RepID=UPI001F5777DE
ASSFPVCKSLGGADHPLVRFGLGKLPSDRRPIADITVSISIDPKLMNGDRMERQNRDVALPEQMQGRWTEIDDGVSVLVVTGGEVICFGQAIAYDYKLVGDDDGALTVSLKIEDKAREDDFQRSNLTELVISPEGEFHAYNTQFAIQFIKADR